MKRVRVPFFSIQQYFLAVLLIPFFFNNCFAQFRFGVDGGVQIPNNVQFKTLVNNGFGLSLSGEYEFSFLPLAVSLNAGYNNWAYKNRIYFSESNSGIHEESFGGINMYSYIVAAGPKLFFGIRGSQFSPYVGIDAGIMAASSSAPGASYGAGFIYYPFLGFRYTITPGIISIDLNVNEATFRQSNDGDSLTWISVNAGIFLLF